MGNYPVCPPPPMVSAAPRRSLTLHPCTDPVEVRTKRQQEQEICLLRGKIREMRTTARHLIERNENPLADPKMRRIEAEREHIMRLQEYCARNDTLEQNLKCMQQCMKRQVYDSNEKIRQLEEQEKVLRTTMVNMHEDHLAGICGRSKDCEELQKLQNLEQLLKAQIAKLKGENGLVVKELNLVRKLTAQMDGQHAANVVNIRSEIEKMKQKLASEEKCKNILEERVSALRKKCEELKDCEENCKIQLEDLQEQSNKRNTLLERMEQRLEMVGRAYEGEVQVANVHDLKSARTLLVEAIQKAKACDEMKCSTTKTLSCLAREVKKLADRVLCEEELPIEEANCLDTKGNAGEDTADEGAAGEEATGEGAAGEGATGEGAAGEGAAGNAPADTDENPPTEESPIKEEPQAEETDTRIEGGAIVCNEPLPRQKSSSTVASKMQNHASKLGTNCTEIFSNLPNHAKSESDAMRTHTSKTSFYSVCDTSDEYHEVPSANSSFDTDSGSATHVSPNKDTEHASFYSLADSTAKGSSSEVTLHPMSDSVENEHPSLADWRTDCAVQVENLEEGNLPNTLQELLKKLQESLVDTKLLTPQRAEILRMRWTVDAEFREGLNLLQAVLSGDESLLNGNEDEQSSDPCIPLLLAMSAVHLLETIFAPVEVPRLEQIEEQINLALMRIHTRRLESNVVFNVYYPVERRP